MHEFEHDFPFCGNPHCELHVRAGDPRVAGFGNWARMPDGRIIGCGRYHGVFLCDACWPARRSADAPPLGTEAVA